MGRLDVCARGRRLRWKPDRETIAGAAGACERQDPVPDPPARRVSLPAVRVDGRGRHSAPRRPQSAAREGWDERPVEPVDAVRAVQSRERDPRPVTLRAGGLTRGSVLQKTQRTRNGVSPLRSSRFPSPSGGCISAKPRLSGWQARASRRAGLPVRFAQRRTRGAGSQISSSRLPSLRSRQAPRALDRRCSSEQCTWEMGTGARCGARSTSARRCVHTLF